ncbi:MULTISPECIES: DUF3993 domain-containing protein [Bacillus]|uniref:DUF3993 domain-containing protein n=1 Tax=Bacillus licheniformis (strain ATCC 14580 / DSM 13 / JCM 2505 / CCUG 7422 / NBRC 12200 / NCIMB 9375 / NCTC 10341 / NRRL NRS-1264 / Gibson 46) TaxID=279010 RepID=Q65K94_BACLD|nr:MULTISPECIES: DUF3993 domain-containing protein [Bacillus]AAU23162.1 hypothetical protein BL03582 [Bacillus licheniformis DSM 13 = ATCC 14580]AAU40520.1 hypothetical protein BLi01622 [Bacillus licheniformis DSM 13 = ATCC 14580]MBG9695533.1 hypothetical protein [Bacillus licheniformis]MCR3920675.1 DUF3993 domain-containing protein [Bacillus licheniformis]MDH3167970.1 DUF3993 domain-containing protein [Bacillus licheniformis]
MKNVWSSLLCALLAAALVFFCADFAKAGEKPTRASLFETLQSVSDVHFQLTEKERTKTDMISLLEPYMEHAMAVKYVEANAFPEQAGWIFYGTDAPEVAIPFFSYGGDTKVAGKDGSYTVYEFVGDQNDGPVSYQKNYQTVTLKNTGGSFKVTDIGQSDTKPAGEEIMSKQPDEKETSSNFADKGEGDQAAFPLFATDVNWTLAGIFS